MNYVNCCLTVLLDVTLQNYIASRYIIIQELARINLTIPCQGLYDNRTTSQYEFRGIDTRRIPRPTELD